MFGIKACAVVLLSLLLSSPVWALSEYADLVLPDGAKAIRYLPKSFKPYRSYGLIVALHGMGQTMESACDVWKGAADHFNYILICPKGSDFENGYSRRPVDDRVGILALKKEMMSQFFIREDDVLLLGFSRGGNFAIELGVLYPRDFPNVVSLYGFFNRGVGDYARRYRAKLGYRRSRFYFVSGKGDLSLNSSASGVQTLSQLGIRSHLFVYDDLLHAYPSDPVLFLSKVRKWMIEG